ncbi:Lactoylglutathione lyase and related lyases [[Actinomadura] parvosata subsp. kistnae]|uniref:Glyoxalase n=1 Tax=[Actinomadura] parvosata subsp. kistnae TaxID=1909395 RepID=A0A1V0A881_9ACTN|nr:VOC family protein [Nonomuraea sp. ATCC 55076]AQZ66352.1 glyoxalase [Nonomuraea sp. ATCC 55076]SPL95621.1 Lactoylglutathione lyase and related lyases [Actinomadura parvosata subsp. kistnae]
MDALYPRLLVRDFPAAVAFYRPVLRELLGVEPVKVLPGYANWDIGGEAGLVLFGRNRLAEAIGTADLPPSGRDTAMLVMKVDDVDAAATRLAGHGATVVAPPQDRPDWAPTLRTAHLRDPEGNLIELQSY